MAANVTRVPAAKPWTLKQVWANGDARGWYNSAGFISSPVVASDRVSLSVDGDFLVIEREVDTGSNIGRQRLQVPLSTVTLEFWRNG